MIMIVRRLLSLCQGDGVTVSQGPSMVPTAPFPLPGLQLSRQGHLAFLKIGVQDFSFLFLFYYSLIL